MLDPQAKRLVSSQRPSNTESKVTGVGVHKSRCDAAITTMAVNQRQVTLPHLPSLLQNLSKNSVEYDFSGMVAVKVDFHFSPPGCWDLAANRVSSEKNIGIITFGSRFSRAGFNSDLVVDGLSQSLFHRRDIFQRSAPRRGPAETEFVLAHHALLQRQVGLGWLSLIVIRRIEIGTILNVWEGTDHKLDHSPRRYHAPCGSH